MLLQFLFFDAASGPVGFHDQGGVGAEDSDALEDAAVDQEAGQGLVVSDKGVQLPLFLDPLDILVLLVPD